MDKRYQVFISSTFKDLQEERQEVTQALLELDCIPSGMELFPAANDSQWDLIKSIIDDCDYYLVIVAGRYGSINGTTGLSYTEMEYRYALEKKKPIIAFVHREPGQITSDKTELSTESRAKLEAFRELVQKKVTKSWSTPAELGSVVSRSVVNLIKTCPSVGWVRADALSSHDAAEEILALKRKVEELQEKIDQSATESPEGSEDLAQGNDIVKIRFSLAHKNESEESEYSPIKLTWGYMFGAIAPYLEGEWNDYHLREFINNMIRNELYADNRNYFECHVNEYDYQTIKIQLEALGLIAPIGRGNFVLTPYGKNKMVQLRAIKKPELLH